MLGRETVRYAERLHIVWISFVRYTERFPMVEISIVRYTDRKEMVGTEIFVMFEYIPILSL